MTQKDLENAFTREQINWLIRNGAKPVGNSDAEVLSNYAKLLWDNGEWYGEDGASKLAKVADAPNKVYDIESLAQAAGFSDGGKDEKTGKTITKGKKFLDAYFGGVKDKGTRERWQTKIVDNFGAGSWDKAKKVLQGALLAEMDKKIANDRADIMEGNADDQGVADWLVSGAMGLTAPRIKNAYKEGREWGANEAFGDVAENVAFGAMPVGLIGRGLGKAIGKAIPKVLPFVAENSGRGAGKILGGAAAEFAAPAAVEVTDYALGNTEFEPEDIIIGGATNLGVNKGLGRAAGLMLNTMGKKVSGKVPKWVKDRLEGQQSSRERANKLVSDARDVIKSANVPEKQAYEYVVKESQNLPDIPKQQEAIDILKVAEQADPNRVASAKIGAMADNARLKSDIETGKKTLKELDEELQGLGMEHDFGSVSDELYAVQKREIEMDKAKTMLGLEELSKLEKSTAERVKQLSKSEKAHASKVLETLPNELDLSARRNLNGIMNKTSLHTVRPKESPVKRLESEFGLPDGTFEKHPELLALFGKDIKPTVGERLGEMAFQWGVNRAGTDTDASVLNQVTGGRIDPKTLREDQMKRRKESAESKAAQVLSLEGLTGDDVKYLQMIKDKPSIVKLGLDDQSENTKFKNWLLLRGNDILREQNSPLVRNAFEVQ